jgi:hypothetical protein
VTDGTNCPEFRQMIEFVLVNAKTLKNVKEEDRHMGREQFTGFRKKQFETLLAAIEMYVSQVRGGYQELLLKKRVPFISVGHDIIRDGHSAVWNNFYNLEPWIFSVMLVEIYSQVQFPLTK